MNVEAMTMDEKMREQDLSALRGAAALSNRVRPVSERTAILQVAPEILAELLKLPPGSYIDAVRAPHDQLGTLEIRIRGAGWVTRLGCAIPRTTGTMTAEYDDDGNIVRTTIDWGLPASDDDE